MSTNRKKAPYLLEKDCILASVHHHFGPEYYNYSEKTFNTLCKTFGIQSGEIIKNLEQVNLKGDEHNLFLMSYPFDLIIEYLTRSHYLIIKNELPQLMEWLRKIEMSDKQGETRDLQFVIAIFVEDFIRHAYNEESVFFAAILLLQKANTNDYNPSQLFYQLEKNTIHKFAAEHELIDNEILSVHNIISDYSEALRNHNALKMLFIALEKLNKELQLHSKIENEILIPKALTLEKKVRKKFRETIALN